MSSHSSINSAEPAVPYSTTLLVKDRCLCLHMQRAARKLARRFDLALEPTGLTNGQFSMLISLNRPDGPEIPVATVSNVAELLGMDRTTVTAAARVLSRRKLLNIQVQPGDRRKKVLRLTKSGLKLLAAAVPIWRQEHEQIEREIGVGAAERLRTDLGLATRRENRLGCPPEECGPPLTPVRNSSALKFEERRKGGSSGLHKRL
jgi:DNA-binding MarR family transcriptional regulator